MKDAMGREISYLRLSVTDGCNLRCLYCRPQAHSDTHTLPPQYIRLLVAAFARAGIQKVRVTGGEPLLRKDILEVVRAVSGVNGIIDIAMTTNAALLRGQSLPLRQAGLKRLNISLDSLDADKYAHITGGGDVQNVLGGIYEAIDAGLGVKVNAVLVRGFNDGEVDALIGLAKDLPLHVRFIELMPLGPLDISKGVPNDEILAKRPWLIPIPPPKVNASDVARLYTVEGYSGQIGFISPVSGQFCDRCNRVRVTSDGKLKPCLGDNSETDLMPYINNARALQRVIREALFQKPQGHCFNECTYTSLRSMDRIGG